MLAAALALAIATPPAALTAGEVATLEEADETLAAGLGRGRRMTVAVDVNGSGPFAFVLDTGADRSVVSDRLAAALRLSPAGPVRMHGIAGVETVPTVRIDRLTVGSRQRSGIVAPVLARPGLGATGLLGVDALASQRVLLDFRAGSITVGPSAARPLAEDAGTIVVTARRRFGQLILTDAAVAGIKVMAVIDTGAQNSIGNAALQRLLLRGDHRRRWPGELVGVTGRVVPAVLTTVPRMKVGGVDIIDMPIAFADVHTFARFGLEKRPAILLGMDVLRSFQRVAIDFGQKKVRFRLAPANARQALSTPCRTSIVTCEMPGSRSIVSR